MKIRKRNTSYLHRFEEEIKEAAKEHDLTKDESQQILDDFFRSFKSYMTDETLPKIIVPHLAIFKPSLKKINKRLMHWLNARRRGNINIEVFNKKFSELWIIRQRLILESKKVVTHPCWHKYKTLEAIKENCFPCEKQN